MDFFVLFICRGAELIESLRKKQVKLQAQREMEILQKIKQKMDRIKANQQKLQPALSLSGAKEHCTGKSLSCKLFVVKFYWCLQYQSIAISVSICH